MRSFILGSLRTAFVVGLLLLGAFFGLARHAEARASELLLGFGTEFLAWLPGTQIHGEPRRLSLNGMELRLVTASTPLPVKEAIARLEGVCRDRSGVENAGRLLEAPLDPGAVPPPGTFVDAGEHEGVLACIDTGRPLSVDELSQRLEAFHERGDLSSLGALRFVLARRSGETTTVLVLWTEGETLLRGAFPKTGDAPGRDPEGVARPPRARRLLSAAEHGAPYSLSVYTGAELEAAALLDWYRRSFESRGWTVTRTARGKTLVARKGGRALAVRVGKSARGETVASVVEMS